jgi:type II secretory pathway component GspD/PulD (secretin)
MSRPPLRFRSTVAATLLAIALMPPAALRAAEGDAPPVIAAPPTISLPPSSELSNLADLTSQLTGVSIQYNPQKIQGTVRLSSRPQVTPLELWDIFNQALIGENFTTVLTNITPAYQVVAVNDAAGLGIAISEDEVAKLKFKPGFLVIVRELKNVSAETALKALGTTVGNQPTIQVRTLGQDDRKLIIAAPQGKLREIQAVLALIDRAGLSAQVQLFRPARTGPQNLQSALVNAWNSVNKLTNKVRSVDVQIAPDNLQVMLISSQEDAPDLLKLAQELDRSEPIETRTYRPRVFSVDEVGSLVEQVLHGDHGEGIAPVVIHDRLTNCLIIRGTAEQQHRVEELLKTLDESPQAQRRQMRTYVIKHRTADDLAKVLVGLIATGVAKPAQAGQAQGQGQGQGTGLGQGQGVGQGQGMGQGQGTGQGQFPGQSPSQILGQFQGQPGGNLGQGAIPGSNRFDPSLPVSSGTAGQAAQGVIPPITAAVDNPVVLTSDPISNSLIAIGDPQSLEQVETLLKILDRPQPQVDLEVLLVQVSSTQNRNLGVELTKLIQSGAVSTSVTSLFGISTQTGTDVTARSLVGASGFGAVVLNPGDYAGVVQALESVTDGKSMIVSHIVVNNNGKASLNDIVSQPYTSLSSTSAVATSGLGGESDAGTQIAISPQISAADYITLTYSISQSAFLGSPTVTSQGSVIPPASSSDNLSSVASIPDGFIAAIGGLSNSTSSHSESRIPWLGSIPFLGWLFKSQTDSESQSRFYAFIRPGILRHPTFGDLKEAGARIAKEAELKDASWPVVEPLLYR